MAPPWMIERATKAPADIPEGQSRNGLESGSRQLHWFLVATFASAIGRNGYLFVCAWVLVTAEFGSASVAVFFAVVSVTELIASPLAGWMADHWDRRRLYVAAEILRSVTLLGLGTVVSLVDPGHAILMFAPILASCDRIALTSSQSMIPSVAKSVSLSMANALVFFLMQSGSLVAAIAAGVLLHVSSPTRVIVAHALAFLVSAFAMQALRQDRISWSTEKGQPTQLVVDATMLHLFAIYALLYTGGVLVSVIGPGFVYLEMAGTAVDFGRMEGAWSAGSIAGAILLIPMARVLRLTRLHLMIIVLSAATFAIVKLLDLPGSLLAFALLGGLYNLGRAATELLLQSHVPGAVLGRAKGAMHTLAVLAGVIVFAVIAVVADAVQPSDIFLAFGAFLALGALALGLWQRLLPVRV